jgi:phytoene synthase
LLSYCDDHFGFDIHPFSSLSFLDLKNYIVAWVFSAHQHCCVADAVDRGRVYLPQEDLKRFGVTEQQVFDKKVDENYQKLMKFEIDRARMYYERARRGVFMLAPDSRLPVQSSLDAYGRILDKIEANGYDNLTKRAYVDKWEKLSIIPFSWYRTLDISRTFPLPGDKQVVDLDV